LLGCASGQVRPTPNAEDLQAELKAVRDENAKLERRIERLEAIDAVKGSKSERKLVDPPDRPATGPAAPVEGSKKNVPTLTVVKLKPKREPAPKISTSVAVVEPDPEALERMSRGSVEAVAAESPPERDPAFAEVQFKQGMDALKTGNLSGAVIKLQSFAAENPKDPRADNALYYSGIGLMGLSDYEAAAGVFQTLIEKYPAGDAVQDGMLKLGECTVRLNRKRDAKDIYKKVLLNFPGTEAANTAEKRLAALAR
jgi:tol-pal system protein YbgF